MNNEIWNKIPLLLRVALLIWSLTTVGNELLFVWNYSQAMISHPAGAVTALSQP